MTKNVKSKYRKQTLPIIFPDGWRPTHHKCTHYVQIHETLGVYVNQYNYTRIKTVSRGDVFCGPALNATTIW